jgi:hypothetical protein
MVQAGGLPMNNLQKPITSFRVDILGLSQRFHESEYGRDGCSQLMRDIGDEVLSHHFKPGDAGDVIHDKQAARIIRAFSLDYGRIGLEIERGTLAIQSDQRLIDVFTVRHFSRQIIKLRASEDTQHPSADALFGFNPQELGRGGIDFPDIQFRIKKHNRRSHAFKHGLELFPAELQGHDGVPELPPHTIDGSGENVRFPKSRKRKDF